VPDFSKIVLSNYTYVELNEVKNLAAEKRALVAKSSYDKDLVLALYDISKNGWFGYPRYSLSPTDTDNVFDRRVTGEAIGLVFNGKMWKQQEVVIDDFCNRFAERLHWIPSWLATR